MTEVLIDGLDAYATAASAAGAEDEAAMIRQAMAEIERLRAVADKAQTVIDYWHDIPDVADHAHALIKALEVAGYSSEKRDTGNDKFS